MTESQTPPHHFKGCKITTQIDFRPCQTHRLAISTSRPYQLNPMHRYHWERSSRKMWNLGRAWMEQSAPCNRLRDPNLRNWSHNLIQSVSSITNPKKDIFERGRNGTGSRRYGPASQKSSRHLNWPKSYRHVKRAIWSCPSMRFARSLPLLNPNPTAQTPLGFKSCPSLPHPITPWPVLTTPQIKALSS